jgi:hypothetical protein
VAADSVATAAQPELQTHLLRAEHGGGQDGGILPATRGRLQEGQRLELPGHRTAKLMAKIILVNDMSTEQYYCKELCRIGGPRSKTALL